MGCQEKSSSKAGQSERGVISYQERNISLVWILTATTTNLMLIHIFIGWAGFVNLHSHLQAVILNVFFFLTVFKPCLINLEPELRKTLSQACVPAVAITGGIMFWGCLFVRFIPVNKKEEPWDFLQNLAKTCYCYCTCKQKKGFCWLKVKVTVTSQLLLLAINQKWIC